MERGGYFIQMKIKEMCYNRIFVKELFKIQDWICGLDGRMIVQNI